MYKGVHTYKKVYQGILGLTVVYRGIQRVYKGTQVYTEVYKGIQNKFDSNAGTTARAIETLMGQYFD